MLFTSPNENQDEVILHIEKPKKQPWLEKKGFIIATFFSIIWLVFIWDYLFSSGWWGSRHELSPAEFIGGFCGLFLPIVLSFLLSSYFDRASQLGFEAQTLRSYLGELIYPTDVGAAYTQALTNALRDQVKEFKKVFIDVDNQTKNLKNQLQQWNEELKGIVQKLNDQTTTSICEISENVSNLTNAALSASEKTSQNALDFNKQTITLQKTVQQTVSSLNPLLQTMQLHIENMKKVEQSFKNINEKTESSVHLQQNVLEKVVTETEQKIQHLDSRFDKNAQSVFYRADETLKRLTKINTALIETIQKIDNFPEIISTIYEKIRDTQKISSLPSNLKQSTNEITLLSEDKKYSMDLLKDATAILDKLQTLSVDMAHIFTPKAENMLWKKYYTGDRAVFMRYITHMLSETQYKKIMELYRTNRNFNQAIDRYMTEFEKITKIASQGDKNKLLLSILVGSDVGRLYMVLADVLKRNSA